MKTAVDLSSIKVQRFKRVEELELDIKDVNILVGTNGSGKSSVLQAIHLATCALRQIEELRSDNSRTISKDDIDYLPTNSYRQLYHNGEWGNTETSNHSKVEFNFLVTERHESSNDADALIVEGSDEESHKETAYCELRTARNNAGLSVRGVVPSNNLRDLLRKKEHYFSAYIPGISGLAISEEKKSKKVVEKSCFFGYSNSMLRNVLLLLSEATSEGISTLEEWMSNMFDLSDFKVFVEHRDETDLKITCSISINNMDNRPVELLGSGMIQMIQIMSYVLLFNPEIVLIDEPDIHLHPTIQEKLPAVLEKISQQYNTKFIIATHSPFIVRGASLDASITWIDDGAVMPPKI